MSELTPQTLRDMADYSKFEDAPRPSILFAHASVWAADRAKLEAMERCMRKTLLYLDASVCECGVRLNDNDAADELRRGLAAAQEEQGE